LLPSLPADCCVGAGHARESRLGARAWPAYASPLGWLSRHCVTAYAGLRPCAPVQGEVSPCEPLWPAFQLVPRLPNPIEHTRPRGIHAPTRSFGIIQTMLLALPNFGLERMGRYNRSGYAGMFFWGRAARAKPKKQKKKKPKKQKKKKPKKQKTKKQKNKKKKKQKKQKKKKTKNKKTTKPKKQKKKKKKKQKNKKQKNKKTKKTKNKKNKKTKKQKNKKTKKPENKKTKKQKKENFR